MFNTTNMPLGIVRGESNRAYHNSGCLGSGMVCDYIQSHSGFKLRHIDKHPLAVRSDSHAMSLGTIIHTMLQGGRIQIVPDEFTTEKGISTKPAAQAWLAGIGDDVPATKKQWTLAAFISIRVKDQLPFIKRAEYEVTARTTINGIICQCKYDLLYNIANRTWFDDIKTTSSPLRAFKKSCWDFKYLHQMAWYRTVGQAVGLNWSAPSRWLVIQTTYPFDFGYLVPDPAELAQAERENATAIQGIADGVFDTPVTEQPITGLIKTDGPAIDSW